MSNLEKQLQLVREGAIDFGQFVAATRGEYRAMAMYLMRRWVTPEWFVLEDAEQELYLGTWRSVWDYDAARGATLLRYVTFSAMYYAKRAMHKARGVGLSGSPDKRPSRFETPLSRLGPEPDDGDAVAIVRLAEDAVAEAALIDAEERAHALAAALEACESAQERIALLAVREAGGLDSAGQVLYDDLECRISLRLGSEEIAERYVRKHAAAVARRLTDDVVNPG